MEWTSEKRKGQKIFVDVVEAEIVGRDIALAASRSAKLKLAKMVGCLLFVVCCLLFVVCLLQYSGLCLATLDPFTW